MPDSSPSVAPSEIGDSANAPPIDEKPYKIIFEANRCIGAALTAKVAPY